MARGINNLFVNFTLQLRFVLTSVIQQTYCVLFYIILH
jgi:hypothetical protein